jgi:sugar (pentulose or hexulose) kinase
MSWLLGMDLGGGGVRCLLVDPESGERHCGTRNWAFPSAEGTFGLGFDLDLPFIWRSIGEACREALAAAGTSGSSVASIAVSALRFGNVILDREGEAIFAVPNRDARGAGEGFQLGANHGEAILADTGLWPMPIHASARLLWLVNQKPDVLEAGVALLSLSDWVNYRLCGVQTTDHSQAGCTGLFDLASRQWCWNRIDELGIPRGLFTQVQDSGTLLGSLSAAAAADLGLAPGTPIGLAGGDTQCGLLGAGAIASRDVASIAGTTAPVQMVTSHPVIDPEGRLWSGHHVVPGLWVLESNGGPMGETLTWISRLLFPASEDPVTEFLAEAAQAETGAAGMLSNLGAEVMNARAPSMPVGQITLSHMTTRADPNPRRHLARAVIEGHACAVQANLAQLSQVSDASFACLKLAGGMSRSDLFAQLLADVTSNPVDAVEISHATALGAALCGAVAASIFADHAEAVSAVVRARKRFEPDPETADASRELFESWSKLRDAGRDTTALAAAAHVTPWVLKAGM